METDSSHHEPADTEVARLISVLTDRQRNRNGAPGDRRAPIHAARRLGELKAQAAIAPLLEVLRGSDVFDVLHSTIIHALQAMGPPVLEPALRANAEATDEGYRTALAEVLSALQVRDERVLAAFVRLLEENPMMGACVIAEYGDPAALPHLVRAFDRHQVDVSRGTFASQTLIELRLAIKELGGELTPLQQEKLRLADEPRRRWAEAKHGAWDVPAAPADPTKIGRNEPCSCGSGKKYKRCHGS